MLMAGLSFDFVIMSASYLLMNANSLQEEFIKFSERQRVVQMCKECTNIHDQQLRNVHSSCSPVVILLPLLYEGEAEGEQTYTF